MLKCVWVAAGCERCGLCNGVLVWVWENYCCFVVVVLFSFGIQQHGDSYLVVDMSLPGVAGLIGGVNRGLGDETLISRRQSLRLKHICFCIAVLSAVASERTTADGDAGLSF